MLVDEPVGAFLAAVASPATPVPAGGSVAALTGAASAALLALVCGVLARHQSTEAGALAERARELQHALEALIDADAEAYAALVAARRSKSGGSEAAVRAAQTPLRIARASLGTLQLARAIEPLARGALLGDVRVAHHLAGAATEAALAVAEPNQTLYADPAARQSFLAEIEAVRHAASDGG